MKLLHTSDWHLGRSLYGRKRYDEFTAFLDWLYHTIATEKVDVLLVAGDIFDTGTPGNRAQELYYRFLCRIAGSDCRHIVITAGNHDSPSFLNAPKELLRVLDVHVIGTVTENPEDEVLVLEKDGTGEAVIVCAVPYLRDKDIRTVAAGESADDKSRKLREGVLEHYAQAVTIAETKRAELLKARPGPAASAIPAENRIPIIAMGHLFTAGAKTVDGDGVRELYVGSLAHIDKDGFPPAIDYLALGHLHVPQIVGGAEHMRYSGSPIAMGFGEAKQEKSVVIVKFKRQTIQSDPETGLSSATTAPETTITRLPVPTFQPLVSISGTLADIIAKINLLQLEPSSAWLEIEYTGTELVGNLREQIEEALKDSTMEVLRIKNRQIFNRVLHRIHDTETLDDLNEHEVFRRCLDACKIADSDRPEMLESYNEIINALNENENP